MTDDLPAINASLNFIAGCLLIAGFRQIRRGNVAAHRTLMLSALAASTLFLVCYLAYHVSRPPTTFAGEGAWRWLYYGILITHVPLATLMVVPIFFLVWMGLTDRIERHRRLARIVFPIWIYVSVTGVVIYLMLYQFFPQPPKF